MSSNEARSFGRVLITGIAGSGGSYLAEYICENFPSVEVHGFARWHSTTQNNLNRIADRIVMHEVDLEDFGSVIAAMKVAKPDAVFHLAAHANVRTSFITPHTVLSNNILGTSNLLEAIRHSDLDPVVQICSTSEVYGQVDPKDVPIREDAPLRPASPYAVSKVAQDLLGAVYYQAYGMKVIRTRMFSYLNPRRNDLFATSFARQIAWIEAGLQEFVEHGNLDSVRTMIDVHDAMRAYWVAVERCRPGEAYNIGGVTTLTVGDLLQRLIAMSTVAIPTRCNEQLLRPADVTLQIPCVDKFVNETGWRAEYSFDQSLDRLLSYWRSQARIAAATS